MVDTNSVVSNTTTKTFSRFGLWYPIATVLISIILPAMPTLILLVLKGASALTQEIIVIFSLVVYTLWVVGAIIAWKINKVSLKEVFSFKNITIGKVALSFIIAIAAQVVTIFIGSLVGNLIGQEIEGNASEILNKDMPTIIIMLSIVMALVFAPICEEILFRSLILDGVLNTSRKLKIKESIAVAISITLSSLLFGLAHFNDATPSGFMTLAITGLFGAWLAFIRIRTNSLSLNILTHMFFNFSAVIFIFFL